MNTSLNTTVQTSTNDIFQQSSSICTATCTNEFSGGNIVVGPGAQVGDITITQKCNADALCTMKNQLDAIATQQLEAIENAQAEAPGNPALITWPSFSVNTSVNFTTQVLANSVTQVINSVCEATTENLIENVNVYIGEGAEVGAIEFTQEGSATAECAIQNTAAVAVSQEASSEQTAISRSGSVWIMLIAIIGIVLLVIALAWIGSENKKSERKTQVAEITALAQAGAIQKGALGKTELLTLLGHPTLSPVSTTPVPLGSV